MKAPTTDWKELLTAASERVQLTTARVVDEGISAKAIGVGASGDVTLLADREAEKEIVAALSGVPGLGILSEEMGGVNLPSPELVAVVDPLDGSSNLSRGIPFYCTSIAIVEGGSLRAVKFALVRNLVNGDVYYAAKGAGATKNGKAIRTSNASDPAESVVGIDANKAPEEVIAGLVPMASRVKRQLHLGANALELCYVAEGKMDASVDVRGRMRVTDVAAAYLILREAGGVIASERGLELDVPLDLSARFGFVAAGNPTLLSELVRLLPSGPRD